MKLIEVLIAVIFYLTAVNGRNVFDLKSEEGESNMDLEKPVRGHTSKHMRHDRESRNLYYNHYDPNDFKGSYSLENELLPKILQQLEEISSYIKSSQATPSQPQIMYVPVLYAVSQNSLGPKSNVDMPKINFSTKFGIDKNRYWGIATDVKKKSGNTNDGSRAMSLNPVEPSEPTVKAPPVEHGSSQAGMTAPSPSTNGSFRCKAALLVCCQQKTINERIECFSKYDCSKTYFSYKVCDKSILNLVIDEFIDRYAPV